MPHLSIITVNLNNAIGLSRTIKSVIDQHYKDFEYIIIDGGSTDGSVDIIKKYSDKLSYWISEPDYGIYNAMNKGIVKARGEYLNFLNSGDWYFDEGILQKVFSISYDEDIIYGSANWVYENGTTKLQNIANEDEITLAYFFKQSLFHQASFFRKHLFSSGYYDENLRIVSDWKFFIEKIIIQSCSIKKVDIVVINYDMTGISCQSEYKHLHETERELVISQLFPVRISRDYNIMILFSDSPLRKYMPFLNKTDGFHYLIAKIVGLLVKSYKIFRILIHSQN